MAVSVAEDVALDEVLDPLLVDEDDLQVQDGCRPLRQVRQGRHDLLEVRDAAGVDGLVQGERVAVPLLDEIHDGVGVRGQGCPGEVGEGLASFRECRGHHGLPGVTPRPCGP